ncbi:pilus assembly FimT family protein [Acinetobacter beijerinckii]|uniref:pilus assembly FimT family protein n=1 Tax=Acinetobacter beijerinckii TaxID=262668 RepID=UPI0024075990|nr:prepilin-type N-terminal cleavage/methylation domain-containing protein [Acinetobacter beijerinckii]
MGKSRGFTLIELMVTIAIFAVIAMMAAPSFSELTRKFQLNHDTRDFVNLLAETRSEAVFKQNNRVLALDNTVSSPYKIWIPTHIAKDSGSASITYDRLGLAIVASGDEGLCFIFKHNSDANLKSYVYVQKGGTVIYNKTATSCPT